MLNVFKKSWMCAFLFPLFILCAIVLKPIQAHAEFVVYVGYTGGPYYEKVRYSDEDMKKMSSTTLYEYSNLDSAYAIRKGFARGVTLTQFFTNTGIKAGKLKRFYLATEDGYVQDDGGEGYDAWYYKELCTTTRYYYPNLFNATLFDADGNVEGINRNTAGVGAVSVPTIIAYESDFHRCTTQEEWDNPVEMRTGLYRLMFGQTTDPLLGDAFSSANAVKSMTCIFDGTPKIEIVNTSVEGEVGDIVTIKTHIEAADPIIEQNLVKNADWVSSDKSVVDFVYDEDGHLAVDANGNFQVKIVGKGTATISGTYGKSPFSNYVAKSNSIGVSGKGGSRGDDGGGDGGGKGDGSGNDDGDGGSGTGDGGNSGDDEKNISKGDDANAQEQTKAGEAAAGIGSDTDGSGGGTVDESNVNDEGSEENDSLFQIKAREKPESKTQAWVVNNKSGVDQQSMIDDPLLIARPAALAVILFGFFIVGFIVRVIMCERAKDPYVDERLRNNNHD